MIKTPNLDKMAAEGTTACQLADIEPSKKDLNWLSLVPELMGDKKNQTFPGR
jgi:hypothetical protein